MKDLTVMKLVRGGYITEKMRQGYSESEAEIMWQKLRRNEQDDQRETGPGGRLVGEAPTVGEGRQTLAPDVVVEAPTAPDGAGRGEEADP